MGRQALEVGELSKTVAKLLESARDEQGVSYRELQRRSGINRMRAQRILTEERPSPAMEPGTRESPLPAGTVVQISGTDWDENLVSAADIEIGQANWVADDLLAAEDYTPEGGNIFVLVPVTVTLTESADSVAVEPASTIWVSYVSPDGQSFDGFVNPLGDALESQPELYPGASATGTLAFEIPADATGGLWAVQDVMQSIAPVYVMAE